MDGEIPQKCCLCQENRDLCNSHVLPEFLYEDLYDDKHRALALSSAAIGPRLIQKGIRERLLCLECEGFLSSSYEDYFARFWFQTARLPDPADGPYELKGYDYTKFKLFHLSILWRASVAAGPAFAQTTLGPHEKKIRQMLRTADPGKPTDYPILGNIWVFPDTRRPARGVVMPPLVTRGDGHHFYGMIYGGCVWNVIVSGKRVGPPLNFGMLTRERILLPVWRIDQFAPVKNFFLDMAQTGEKTLANRKKERQ